MSSFEQAIDAQIEGIEIDVSQFEFLKLCYRSGSLKTMRLLSIMEVIMVN